MAESKGCANALRSVTRGAAVSISGSGVLLGDMGTGEAMDAGILYRARSESKNSRDVHPCERVSVLVSSGALLSFGLVRLTPKKSRQRRRRYVAVDIPVPLCGRVRRGLSLPREFISLRRLSQRRLFRIFF